MYGQEALENALVATEWVLSLPYPPGDNEQAVAAAAGEASEGWPAIPPTLAGTALTRAQARWEATGHAAIPTGAPRPGHRACGAAASSSSRSVFAAGWSAPAPPPARSMPPGVPPAPAMPQREVPQGQVRAAASRSMPPMPRREVPP